MSKYIEDSQEASSSNGAHLDGRERRIAKIKNFIKWTWRLYALGILLVVGLFVLLSFDLPSFEELENPRSRIASNIYSSDDVVLGKYYIENRTPVEYDSLSPHLIHALIATEDGFCSSAMLVEEVRFLSSYPNYWLVVRIREIKGWSPVLGCCCPRS